MAAEAQTPPEERIGDYRVHPVAAMFPLLEGEAYEAFKESIEVYGQQKAIVVQGDLLLDGRNRLRACIDLEIRPRVIEFDGRMDIPTYIRVANIDRRNLTDDVRSAICYQIFQWDCTQKNAAKQNAARVAQGHHGAEGGRGKKKALDLFSDPRVSERDLVAKNAASTVGQIAEAAKVTRHKAAQAVAVAKAAPDLLEQVKAGAVKLKDAFAQVRAVAPQRALPASPKPRRFDPQKKAETYGHRIGIWIAACPSPKRQEFKTYLLKECKRLCEK
jgi:hypothetical protein